MPAALVVGVQNFSGEALTHVIVVAFVGLFLLISPR
jgi:hypothetical protein